MGYTQSMNEYFWGIALSFIWQRKPGLGYSIAQESIIAFLDLKEAGHLSVSSILRYPVLKF
jgi:hypothetical protein